jgi:hypothetical protein
MDKADKQLSKGLRWENVDIFYRHLECFMDFWDILWYILCSFGAFFPVLVSCLKKNLSTLARVRRGGLTRRDRPPRTNRLASRSSLRRCSLPSRRTRTRGTTTRRPLQPGANIINFFYGANIMILCLVYTNSKNGSGFFASAKKRKENS